MISQIKCGKSGELGTIVISAENDVFRKLIEADCDFKENGEELLAEVLSNTASGEIYRIERRNTEEQLNDGPNGEPAVVEYYPNGNISRIEHYRDGVRNDGINGEIAVIERDEDGKIYSAISIECDKEPYIYSAKECFELQKKLKHQEAGNKTPVLGTRAPELKL